MASLLQVLQSMTLAPEQRSLLLRIARSSIAAVLDGERPVFEAPDERLQEPAGAFVTLNDRAGDLRGCIGSIQPVLPLAQAVSSSAISAAFRDPRFHPVTKDELPSLHIEISVLGPVVPATRDEIEVGRDGLIISRGGRTGLLLPQVATEWGWNVDEFLTQTCVKAGLPRDAWRASDVRIERFSAEIFGE
jgi:AmmeMemoRadiSam system protein A